MFSVLLPGVAIGLSAAVVLGLLVWAVLSQRGDEPEELCDQFSVDAFMIGRCETCGLTYNAGPVGSDGCRHRCFRCQQESDDE